MDVLDRIQLLPPEIRAYIYTKYVQMQIRDKRRQVNPHHVRFKALSEDLRILGTIEHDQLVARWMHDDEHEYIMDDWRQTMIQKILVQTRDMGATTEDLDFYTHHFQTVIWKMQEQSCLSTMAFTERVPNGLHLRLKELIQHIVDQRIFWLFEDSWKFWKTQCPKTIQDSPYNRWFRWI